MCFTAATVPSVEVCPCMSKVFYGKLVASHQNTFILCAVVAAICANSHGLHHI